VDVLPCKKMRGACVFLRPFSRLILFQVADFSISDLSRRIFGLNEQVFLKN